MTHGRRRTGIVCLVGTLAFSGAARAAELVPIFIEPGRHELAARDTTVSILFDRALAPASVDASRVRVFGKSSGLVGGVITMSNGDRTLTVVPDRPFSAGETVVVNLSHDLVAADGSPLRAAGFAWEFSIRTAATTRAIQTTGTLVNRSEPSTHIGLYGAFAADLNGDGWLDLTTVSEYSQDLRTFMNSGGGTGTFPLFLPPQPLSFGISPNETADFDRDGKMDVAVASRTNSLWIVRGNGDGTWAAAQEIALGSQPRGVAVLDVDGDADPDVATLLGTAGTFALLLNDGAGGFAPPITIPAVVGLYLAAGDMDADGIVDLVTGGSQVTVHRGNGDGTFTALPGQPVAGTLWTLITGDLDVDGTLDVVAATFGGGPQWLRGLGGGALAAPVVIGDGDPISVDLADLDGDGDPEVIASDLDGMAWRIFVNDGGAFTLDQSVPAPGVPSCATPFDFDGDGDLDLAFSDEDEDVVVLAATAAGTPSQCPGVPANCRGTAMPGKAKLALQSPASSTGRQLQFTWRRGLATSAGEWGDPLAANGYHLCVYDGGTLVGATTAAAGPAWRANKTGFDHRNDAGTPSGTTRVRLTAGDAGKAAIRWKGKGALLSLPSLTALGGPLQVQVRRHGATTCWGATFIAPFRRQTPTSLRAVAD